ncbi:hypothetical protein, partial [Candidatus Rickettsia kedanie]|uniref:hypothetical protein n=1 Tax=Candidatus Rickettsia kedanie TaxID=3115352 RepID=UPI00399CA995
PPYRPYYYVVFKMTSLKIFIKLIYNNLLLYSLYTIFPICNSADFKAIDTKEAAKTGLVEIRAEHNHLTDHTKNTQILISEIQNGKINKNTVIAIECKQYGENLGMKDVIKIATILEYNEKKA